MNNDEDVLQNPYNEQEYGAQGDHLIKRSFYCWTRHTASYYRNYIIIFIALLSLIAFLLRKRRLDAHTYQRALVLQQQVYKILHDQQKQSTDYPAKFEPYVAVHHCYDSVVKNKRDEKAWFMVEKLIDGDSRVYPERQNIEGVEAKCWKWVGPRLKEFSQV